MDGVFLTSLKSKIRVDNTLDKRLEFTKTKCNTRNKKNIILASINKGYLIYIKNSYCILNNIFETNLLKLGNKVLISFLTSAMGRAGY